MSDAGDVVNRWVRRAAFSAVVYGMSLLGLGGMLGADVASGQTNFGLELMAALGMAVAKGFVARAAIMVHRRLTPVARQICGHWILVLALVEIVLALSAFGGTFIFSTLAKGEWESVCFALYLFRWSLLLALPLECAAGFALWRVQVRAERYAGEEA